jgi:hypothetical protein
VVQPKEKIRAKQSHVGIAKEIAKNSLCPEKDIMQRKDKKDRASI